MLAIHPSRLLTFPTELRDILEFKICKRAGHIFVGDLRSEMERHYAPAHSRRGMVEKAG